MTTAALARGPPMDTVKDEPSDSDASPRRSLRCASRKPSESATPAVKPEPVEYSHPDPDSPVDFSQKPVSVDGDANASMDGPGGAEGSVKGGPPRTFTCDVCLKDFSNAANMRRHRIRHSGVKPFECKFCQKKFFRKDHMREHMTHKHNTVQQLECYFCPDTFDKEKDLIQHVIRAHADRARQLHCHLCSFSAETIGRYLWHLSTSHPKKPLTYHAYTAPDPPSAPTTTAAPKRCKIFSAKRKIEDAGSEGSGESEKLEELLENNIPPALPEFGGGGVQYVSLLNPRMLEEREGAAEGGGGGGNVYLLVAGESGQTATVETNGHGNQKAGSNRRKNKAPVRLAPTPDTFPSPPAAPRGVKREHSASDEDSEPDTPVYRPEEPSPSASGMDTGSLNGNPAEQHKCPYCLIAYPDNVMYLLHKMLHSRHQPYKCAVCQHQYPNRYEFYAHIVNHRS